MTPGEPQGCVDVFFGGEGWRREEGGEQRMTRSTWLFLLICILRERYFSVLSLGFHLSRILFVRIYGWMDLFVFDI